MKIDIWSDYICPFCTVGERHLELALENFDGRDDVEITWRSFQLDPSAPKRTAQKTPEYLSQTKGMSMAQVEQMSDGLAARAKQVGLEYNWRDSYSVNTFDIHRVGHWAREQGKGVEFDHLVKRGYFTDGLNVGEPSVLREIAEQLELDGDRVEEIMDSDEYSQAVVQEIAMARQIGIQGVPFFIFNGQFAVSGAQPVELFEQALAQAAEAGEPDQGPVIG